MTIIIAATILGIAILTIRALNSKADVLDYNTTTNGVHDWLKRPDGTFCMNDKSQATIDMQKGYQDAKCPKSLAITMLYS